MLPFSQRPLPDEWRGKNVLVTGVCGTIGSKLLNHLTKSPVGRVTGIDNNESALFFLEEQYKDASNVELYLCDVRDQSGLSHHFRDIDVVLHAAALKHVRLCERSPAATIATNVLGVQNVIEAAIAGKVSRVLFTSSDKAVNPTNVMGTSKLLGERLFTAANGCRSGKGPIFASTRFGNVLGSNGSVVPLFKQQVRNGGPVTLTDERMTRFIMSISEAAQLVMESVFLAQGGEVFVTKMPVVRIIDLALVLIEEFAGRHGHDPKAIEVRVVGRKPGEKAFEELLNDEEVRRTVELDRYFVALPAFESSPASAYANDPRATKAYNSETEPALSREEIREFLRTARLLDGI